MSTENQAPKNTIDEDDFITPVSRTNDDFDDSITPVNELEDNDDLITSVNDDKIEPVVTETKTAASSAPMTTEPVINQVPIQDTIISTTKDSLASISSRINPFTQKIGKGFFQVRQYATEKLGTAEDVTQLPEEYKDLEKRVDALRDVHTNLLKVTKTYGVPNYDYPESILGLTNSVTNQIQQFSLASTSLPSSDRAPKTISHAFSRVATQSSNEIGQTEPYGKALSKYAAVADKLGNARLVMDHEIVTNFNNKLQHTLKTSIEGALKARKEVQAKRLSLDAAKSKYNGLDKSNNNTASLDSARLEVEAAEDQFVGAVEQATHLMKALLQDPEPLRDLSSMANAQLAYFKEANELFSELVPELQALLATQETSYNESNVMKKE